MLALSVFAPWYGVSVTAIGAAEAQQNLARYVQQYGNADLQAESGSVEAKFASLVGRQVATVSARQTLRFTSWILLALGGIALLASLLRLADMRGLLYATGGQIALLGSLATLVVLFRLLRPPVPSPTLELSLSWGVWVALLGAASVLSGGLIERSAQLERPPRPKYGPGPPLAQMPR